MTPAGKAGLIKEYDTPFQSGLLKRFVFANNAMPGSSSVIPVSSLYLFNQQHKGAIEQHISFKPCDNMQQRV